MNSYTRQFLFIFLFLEVVFTSASEPFCVTYYIAGVKHIVQRSTGESLNLPSPSACGDMPFYGWSTTFSSEVPTFVSNKMPVTTDMTVHAVYLQSPADSCYARVTEQLSDWRGKYLIACSNYVANGKVGGDKKGGIGWVDSNMGISKYYDKVNDILPIEWGDLYCVEIEAVNDNSLSDGYLMKTQDNQYNYITTASSSGISCNTNISIASKYPINIRFHSNQNIALNISDKSFQTNASYFKYYKAGKYTPVFLYKRTVTPAVYSLGQPETIKITNAKYATYCSERALDFSTTGITPYVAAVDNGVVKLKEIVDGVVPSGTGIILYKDVEEPEQIAVPFTICDTPLAENNLEGTLDRTMVYQQDEDGSFNYILQRNGTSVSFNIAQPEGAWLAAHRAYLKTTYNTASSRMSVFFEDEETSGVERPVFSTSVSQSVYDLQGQRLNSMKSPGLYIVNGRKVLVR